MQSGLVEAAEARLQRWYPQFGSVVPPLGTAAVRAWRGRIQPFPDGTFFTQVMAHLQVGDTVRVGDRGRLVHPPQCKKRHEFQLGFSDRLNRSFEIVLLDFEGLRHPRVYAVSPEISRRAFPNHPHLRDDQPAFIDGKPLTALCVYLSSDGVLDRDGMQLVHVLDYTSMFLAKHLVFSATCFLSRISMDKPPQTICADPDLSVGLVPREVYDGVHAGYAYPYRTDVILKTMQDEVEDWLNRGYRYALWPAVWVGPVAPHEVNELLRTVDHNAECPCGSGEAYADCHREEHRVAVRA